MSQSPFATTPSPPYCAVVFSSQRLDDDNGCGAMADRACGGPRP